MKRKFTVHASSKTAKSYEYHGYRIYQAHSSWLIYDSHGKLVGPEFNSDSEAEEFIDAELSADDDQSVEAATMWGRSYRYEVHWISPHEGNDCLLGGSNDVKEANDIAKRMADHIFTSPFESPRAKYDFLDSMYVYDSEADDCDLMTYDTEEYIDNLMSELSSKIK